MSEPTTTRSAERDRLAERVVAQRAALVARIRRTLSACDRRVDADDIFSTTLRRVDVMAAAARLVEGIPDEQLLALATAIANNAILESRRKASRMDRAHHTLAAQRADACAQPSETDPTTRVQRLNRARQLLDTLDPRALQVVGLHLRGVPWSVIACEVNASPQAVRRLYYRAIRACAAQDSESDEPGRLGAQEGPSCGS